MDVRTFGASLALATLLSACGMNKSSKQVFNDNSLMKVDGTCASAVIRDEFAVAWKDGTHTLVKAPNVEDFKENFLELHKDQIRVAEYNILIKQERPSLKGLDFEEQALSSGNWGQQLIEADYAWNQGYYGQNVVVGVVDTQTEFSHPLLRNSSYKVASGNGNREDAYGRGNFTGKPFCDPSRENECALHGTHVTGIIAAEHNQGPMMGVAPQAKIIGSAFLATDGSGKLVDAVNALSFAADNGAKIINASWGAENCSVIIREKFIELTNRNILLVVASGNGDFYGNGYDIFRFPISPASFNLATQITVAAATERDFKAQFSNFSFSLVHLAAPGQKILSTIPMEYGGYEEFSGTSMAAPFVSGAAAVLWSARPEATALQIKKALLDSVDVRPGHEYEVLTRGRLNLRKALQRILSI